jgi:hypothetical protein
MNTIGGFGDNMFSSVAGGQLIDPAIDHYGSGSL